MNPLTFLPLPKVYTRRWWNSLGFLHAQKHLPLGWLSPSGLLLRRALIKLNVDAAIAHSKATLAVIARNEAGVVIKIWIKIIPKSSPLRVEAEAILWALQLAKGEQWRYICVESDSKLSIDAILDRSGCPLWPISTLVFDICLFAKSFLSCSLLWVCRSGNAIAHEVAKYALVSFVSFNFVSSNLLASLAFVCKEDALSLSVSVWFIILQLTKK